MKRGLYKFMTMLVLSLTLCVGALAFSAYAAEVTQEASDDTVTAGESVTVTLSLDEDIPDCTTLAYALHYDGSLFTLRSGTSGTSEPRMNHTSPFRGEGDDCFIILSFVDETGRGTVLSSGRLYSLVFSSSALVQETRSGNFTLEPLKSADSSFELIGPSAGAAISVTVEPVGETGYTAALPEETSAGLGEQIAVPVTLGQGTECEQTEYAAVYLELSFDPSHLRFVKCDDPSVTAEPGEGTVTLVRYGSSGSLGDIITLFETLAPGRTDINLTSAFADADENAARRDTPPAKIKNGTFSIRITQDLPITLPSRGFTGDDISGYGEDYIFEVDTVHYLIGEITVSCDGSVVPFTDNGDGTYIVPGEYVTGPLVIRADTALRTFAVGVSGNGKSDVTAETTAAPGEAFTFTIDKKSGYNYAVSVLVADKSVTPTVSGGTYTIPAEKVTGDIAITVTKNANASGTGGRTYAGGTAVSAASADSGTGFTISAAEYLKLSDKRSAWLITVSGDPGTGKTFAYAGSPMYRCGDKWLWIVFSAKDASATETDANSALTVQTGESAGTLSRQGDVNASGYADINDAILIHSEYNAQISSGDAVTLLRLLESDLNGDGVLDMRDAAMLMALIK